MGTSFFLATPRTKDVERRPCQTNTHTYTLFSSSFHGRLSPRISLSDPHPTVFLSFSFLLWIQTGFEANAAFVPSRFVNLRLRTYASTFNFTLTKLMHIMNSIVGIKLWTRPFISVSDHTGKLFLMDGQAYYWKCEDENLSFSHGLGAFKMRDKVHTVSPLYLDGRCWTPGARLFVLCSLPHCAFLLIILSLHWLRS